MPPAAQKFLRSSGPRIQTHPRLPVSLRLSTNVSAPAGEQILSVLPGLPALAGSPIYVQVLPHLTAYRGKLLSGLGSGSHGIPVHAASFIRRREIVLEAELLRVQRKLRLITVHEIFHFVWVRLGNRDRAEYDGLLRRELLQRARGELGESSDRQKAHLPTCQVGDVAWKFYVCESFCDTAAWLYAGIKQHGEFTLAARWRNSRRLWFELKFAGVRSY